MRVQALRPGQAFNLHDLLPCDLLPRFAVSARGGDMPFLGGAVPLDGSSGQRPGPGVRTPSGAVCGGTAGVWPPPTSSCSSVSTSASSARTVGVTCVPALRLRPPAPAHHLMLLGQPRRSAQERGGGVRPEAQSCGTAGQPWGFRSVPCDSGVEGPQTRWRSQLGTDAFRVQSLERIRGTQKGS